MIYLRQRGGEDLKDAITRAIQVAAAGDDIVELIYAKTSVTIHPTWVETIAQFWREKHNAKITEKDSSK